MFQLPSTDVRLQISAFDNSATRSSQLQLFALGAPAPKRCCLGSVVLPMLQLYAAFGADSRRQSRGDEERALQAFAQSADGVPVVWFDLGEADAGAIGLQCRLFVHAHAQVCDAPAMLSPSAKRK